MPKNKLKSIIRDVPDFPKHGINFKDITPVLRENFELAVEEMDKLLTSKEWDTIDALAGIESRGFIFGAALALHKKKGFIIIRKPGKLPGRTARMSYGLEYGRDSLEMQYGTGNILIVDDVLATGGTMQAAANLAVQTGHKVEGFITLIDLKYLNHFEWNGIKPRSVITYES